MIEYLNFTSITVVLTIITLLHAVWMRSLDLGRIWQKIQPLKDVFDFLCKLPKWLNYYNDLNYNLERLDQKRATLHSRETDVLLQVTREEDRTGFERRQEVANWLRDATGTRGDVSVILNNLENWTEWNLLLYFVYLAWSGNRVEKLIAEIDELMGPRSLFRENGSLVLDAGRKIPLPSANLLGYKTLELVKYIVGWVRNVEDPNKIIGVYGDEGIGKSALMIEIHNELLRDFNVYMVYINGEDLSVNRLQSKIAKVLVGEDLKDEDEIRRAAMLSNVLRKKNRFVLILDGLHKDVDLDKVGIPIHLNGHIQPSQGKLIITSRNKAVARRMAGHNTHLLEPLLDKEAEELFDRELRTPPPNHPDIGSIKREIIRKRCNIPGKVKNIAGDLRGQDDISEWRIILEELVVYS
ncbi:hypothetical protein Ancab_025337 [Ancistrocladus abbreviatus]